MNPTTMTRRGLLGSFLSAAASTVVPAPVLANIAKFSRPIPGLTDITKAYEWLTLHTEHAMHDCHDLHPASLIKDLTTLSDALDLDAEGRTENPLTRVIDLIRNTHGDDNNTWVPAGWGSTGYNLAGDVSKAINAFAKKWGLPSTSETFASIRAAGLKKAYDSLSVTSGARASAPSVSAENIRNADLPDMEQTPTPPSRPALSDLTRAKEEVEETVQAEEAGTPPITDSHSGDVCENVPEESPADRATVYPTPVFV